jgi:hypothetical protein
MPETTASQVEPISSPPVFDLNTSGLTLALDFSVRKCHWLVSILAILFAAFSGFESLREAQSAPQQAADAAITLMIAVVPYLFARTVDEFVK